MVEAGVDVGRGRAAVLRPADGRPDHPGGGASRRSRRVPRSADVLRDGRRRRRTGAPTLVMTYWNPVERYGVGRFADDLAAAGGVGVITPDLTPDEAGPWLAATAMHGLDRVFLVAPSTTDARIAIVARAAGLRLRRLDHGRHRGAHECRLRCRQPGGSHQPPPTYPSASASASPPGSRPPRWPPTPTASSSAPPSSAPARRPQPLGRLGRRSRTGRRPRRRGAPRRRDPCLRATTRSRREPTPDPERQSGTTPRTRSPPVRERVGPPGRARLLRDGGATT